MRVPFLSLDVGPDLLNEPVGSHPITRHGMKNGSAQGIFFLIKLIRIRVSCGWHLKPS